MSEISKAQPRTASAESDESAEYQADEYVNSEDDELTDRDIEAPDADTAEQHLDLVEREGRESDRRTPPPLEADPSDAADQRRVVEIDEEDYR